MTGYLFINKLLYIRRQHRSTRDQFYSFEFDKLRFRIGRFRSIY